MRQFFNTWRQDFDLAAKEMTTKVSFNWRSKVSLASRFVTCCAWSCVFNGVIFAADGVVGKDVTFLYGLDFDFMYLTEAKGFSSDRASALATEPGQSSSVGRGGTSTFGLKKSEFNFEWRLPRGIAFQATLRPDAVQRSDNGGMESKRELDTRSGQVVEEMPSVHFLDGYRIIVKKQAIEARIGVERSVLDDFMVTPELLGFGLRVRGPEKSFTMGLYAPEALYLGDVRTDNAVGFGLGVLSGRDERHDGRAGDTTEVGESPSKQDPYWGATLNVNAKFNVVTRAALSLAITEERRLTGKTRQEWYGAGVRRRFVGVLLPDTTIAMELRQFRQSYKIEGTKISDVRLMSFGVTSRIHVSSDDAALLGVWFGSGDLHPEAVLSISRPSKGVQAEAGWRWMAEEQLEFVTMMSREWRRDGTESGGTEGGFIKGDSKSSAQSRFAIQVRYNIGGQI